MLALLIDLVLAVHLLAMNLATGLPLVILWLGWRQFAAGDREAGTLACTLARAAISLLGVGMVLGGVLLVGLWIGQSDFFAAAGRIELSRYWFAAFELLFYALCLGGYLWLADRIERVERARFVAMALLCVLAGTDLAYHFPPLFAVIGVLVEREGGAGEPVRLVRAMMDAEVVALVGHFLLASVSVSGLAAGLVARYRQSARADLAIRSAWLSLAATSLQLPVGLWLLSVTGDETRERLLGGSLLATGAMALALVATVGLLNQLLALALGEAERRSWWKALGLVATIVVLMVVGQQQARQEGVHRPNLSPAVNDAEGHVVLRTV